MKHECTVCKKRIPKPYQKAHRNWHTKIAVRQALGKDIPASHEGKT